MTSTSKLTRHALVLAALAAVLWQQGVPRAWHVFGLFAAAQVTLEVGLALTEGLRRRVRLALLTFMDDPESKGVAAMEEALREQERLEQPRAAHTAVRLYRLKWHLRRASGGGR